MKIKKIFSIILFLFIILISNKIFGLELDIGDTHTFELRDVTNGSNVISKFTGASSNSGIIEIEEIETGLWPFKSITSIKITAKKEGTAELTLSGTYTKTTMSPNGEPVNTTDYITKKISVKVVDPAKEMEEAYKNMPSADADALTIQSFMSSDITYNDSKNLNTISIETLEKWKATLEDWRNKNPEMKGTYTPLIGTLNNYISYKKGTGTEEDLDTYDKTISDSFEDAVEATKEYIAMKINGKTIGSRGDQGTFSDVLDDIGNYKPTDIDSGTANKVEGIASKILTTVTNVGIVVAILMLAILGIKYMLGSVEERAEYKKDLVPYFVGAGLLFGITAFVKVLMIWGQTISNI